MFHIGTERTNINTVFFNSDNKKKSGFYEMLEYTYNPVY